MCYKTLPRSAEGSDVETAGEGFCRIFAALGPAYKIGKIIRRFGDRDAGYC